MRGKNAQNAGTRFLARRIGEAPDVYAHKIKQLEQRDEGRPVSDTVISANSSLDIAMASGQPIVSMR